MLDSARYELHIQDLCNWGHVSHWVDVESCCHKGTLIGEMLAIASRKSYSRWGYVDYNKVTLTGEILNFTMQRLLSLGGVMLIVDLQHAVPTGEMLIIDFRHVVPLGNVNT